MMQIIEPIQLARRRQCLQGHMPIKGMTRLASSLYADNGDAEYNLLFGIDSTGQANITGQIQSILSLLCHRCMEEFKTTISANLTLGIVNNISEAESLAEKYEPLVVDESQIALSYLIEDELMLALPLIIRHPDEQCHFNAKYSRDLSAVDGEQQNLVENNPGHGNLAQNKVAHAENNPQDMNKDDQKPNPFSILEQLKSKQ